MPTLFTQPISKEQKILNILRRNKKRGSREFLGIEEYSDWEIRKNLSPQRNQLLMHLCFKELKVLELSAGFGGWSRFLAEESQEYQIQELNLLKLEILKEKTQGCTNTRFTEKNIFHLNFNEKFDVVVLGEKFLEDSIQYRPILGSEKTSFQICLEKIQDFLHEESVVLFSFENPFGLKRWAGSQDDQEFLFQSLWHSQNQKQESTFHEFHASFKKANFDYQKVYYPFPDIFMPNVILDEKLLQKNPELAAELMSSVGFKNYYGPKFPVFPYSLVARHLGRSGNLEFFMNGFLTLHSQSEKSWVLEKLTKNKDKSICGWSYTHSRKLPTLTEFYERENALRIRKKSLFTEDSKRIFGDFIWNSEDSEVIQEGKYLREILQEFIFLKKEENFLNLMTEFHQWSFEKWKLEQTNFIDGIAIDLGIGNAKILEDGSFVLYDFEWTCKEPVSKTWFVLRNSLALLRDADLLSKEFLGGSIQEIYKKICLNLGLNPQFEEDLKKEKNFQNAALSDFTDPGYIQSIALDWSQDFFPESRWPKKSADELVKNFQIREITRLRLEMEHEQKVTLIRIARKIDHWMNRIPKIKLFFGKIFWFFFKEKLA